MITELSSFDVIRHIPCPFPEAHAVIEGNNPGWIFVDDAAMLTSALIWAQGIEGFYIIGDANNSTFLSELSAYTSSVLMPRLRKAGYEWFEIGGSPEWDDTLARIFQTHQPERSRQMVFTLRVDSVLIPSTNTGIEPVTSAFLSLPLVGMNFIHNRITQFWEEEATFLERGLGYASVIHGEIASLCISSFVSGNTHVINIETHPTHRRKGHAQAAAGAFIAECLRRHAQPHWDCMEENIPSQRLAQKLGLTLNHRYTLFSFAIEE